MRGDALERPEEPRRAEGAHRADEAHGPEEAHRPDEPRRPEAARRPFDPHRPAASDASSDPGVPEAIARTLIRLREQLGVDAIDRLWIFPPVRRGRRERGLVAVSTFLEEDARRGMVTVAYVAEQTGKGVSVEPSFTEQGEAPPDRFPEVMRGVVRRSSDELGDPREVEIARDAENFEALLEEFDHEFLKAGGPDAGGSP
jgi:hypothetical protein